MSSVRPARVVLLRLVVLATILALVFAALSSAAVSADEKIGLNHVSVHATKTVVNTVEVSPISVGLPTILPTRPSECPTGQPGAVPVQPQEAPEQEHQVKYPPSLPAIQAPKGTATSQAEATTTAGHEQTGLGKSSTAFPDLIKVEAANPTTQPDEQQQATPSAADNRNCPTTDDTSDSGLPRGNTGNGSGDGNGQTTPSYTCGGKEYVLEQPGSYYCLDFRKIWVNADDLVTSPHLDVDASVSLRISLNGQFLGSFECTATGCTQLVVFLANFDPDTANFNIEEDGLPQGWRLHSDHRDGATFLVLQNPPGQGLGPACRITSWLNYPGYYVTECLLVIANQQEASTGGTGEDNSGGGGGTGVGGGGSTGGASTAPGTSSVPASEAASPRSDAQPAGSSEALAPQQPATEPSPASAAASPMPPLPQVLPRTGQPQALTSLAGIGLVLLGCGVILLRRPARAR
jgi:LPXTG-motif cell wall-anchored protein